MEPPQYKAVWSPVTSSVSQNLKDTLWIYDAGDKQGLLFEKVGGQQEWFFYKIQSRESDSQGHIHEIVLALEDDEVPLRFFAKESYPCSYTRQGDTRLFLLPTTQIQIMPLQALKQHPPSLPLPLLSPPPYPAQSLPVLPVLPRSTSHPRGPKQSHPHNRRKAEPTQTSSPSLNQSFHAQRRQQAPAKPVRHPPRQPSTSHSAGKLPVSPHPSFQPPLAPSS